MQFESLKHNLCVVFADIVNDDMLKNNRVFFVTPAGVISGFITSPKEGEVLIQEKMHTGQSFMKHINCSNKILIHTKAKYVLLMMVVFCFVM